MFKNILLLDVKISRVTPTLAYQQICQWVQDRQQKYVCVAPVSTLVDAKRDSNYRQVVNAADMVTPDGVPVVWLAKLKGAREIQRTYGPDLMRLVCNQGQSLGLRHFFYGGTQQTLVQLQNCLKAIYPQIKMVGVYAPPFRFQAEQESKEILQLMNNAQADVLWIGLGSPKQDFWMHIHRPLLNVPVMVGSGAAFDFLSQVKPEAPRWMQNIGMGWFFRLCCEPERLWRRYIIGNSLFLYYVFKDLLTRIK